VASSRWGLAQGGKGLGAPVLSFAVAFTLWLYSKPELCLQCSFHLESKRKIERERESEGERERT
jgi:hypothetical protein